jgi:transcriptional regulator with XRE-family HTH domain
MRESTISKHAGWGAGSEFALAIGSAIRTARLERRLTQRQVAGILSGAFVSRVEAGDAVPSLPALAYLLARLEVPITEFFDKVSSVHATDRLDAGMRATADGGRVEST